MAVNHPLAWVLVALAAGAAPRPSATTPAPASGASAAPPAGPACPVGARGALSELACEVFAVLGSSPGAIVLSAPLAGADLGAATAPTELGSRLTAVIAGALDAAPAPGAFTPAAARAQARRARAPEYVYLTPRLEQGELRVTAERFVVARGFWDRVRSAEPTPSAHVFAARRADAEVRSFFPPVPLVAGAPLVVKTPESALALACGDVDGDGASEIALVGRRRVVLGRVRARAWITLASVEWSSLGPVAPAPLREPIASARLQDHRYLEVGLSDRADWVRLDGRLAPLRKAPRRLPWPGGGCVKFGPTALAATLEPCATDEPTPGAAALGRPSDAIAGLAWRDRSGVPHLARALRHANEASASVLDERARRVTLTEVGAALALGDLDLDGEPELLASLPTTDPRQDAVVVRTWREPGALEERFRLAVPGGVHALATCPSEGLGAAAWLVQSGSSLWILQ